MLAPTALTMRSARHAAEELGDIQVNEPFQLALDRTGMTYGRAELVSVGVRDMLLSADDGSQSRSPEAS